jgi:hypothetical protein
MHINVVRSSGTAASITRLGGYRLRLLPGVKGVGWTEGTAAGKYDIRRLRSNPCTSSMKGLMQGLPVALLSRSSTAVDVPGNGPLTEKTALNALDVLRNVTSTTV